MKAVFVLLLATSAMAADFEGVRAVLRGFNAAAGGREPEAMRRLFTVQADYSDGDRRIEGPDAIVTLLLRGQTWSEVTPPVLQEEGIRFIGPFAALVDARLIRYGSTIVKSSIRVVLLVEKEKGVWKISSWRVSSCRFWSFPE